MYLQNESTFSKSDSISPVPTLELFPCFQAISFTLSPIFELLKKQVLVFWHEMLQAILQIFSVHIVFMHNQTTTTIFNNNQNPA